MKRIASLAISLLLLSSIANADGWKWGSGYKGDAPNAIEVETDTLLFSGLLSSSDIDVQKALDTLDNVTGATIPSGLTANSVPFSDGSNFVEDNPGFTYIVGTGLTLSDDLSVGAGAHTMTAAGDASFNTGQNQQDFTVSTPVYATMFKINNDSAGFGDIDPPNGQALLHLKGISRTDILWHEIGSAAPPTLANDTNSAGDKCVFWNTAANRKAIGVHGDKFWFQSGANAASNEGIFSFYTGSNTATTTEAFRIGANQNTSYLNTQLGDATTEIHGINTAPVANQMLTSSFTEATANTSAEMFNSTFAHSGNTTSGNTEVRGYDLTLNSSGLNSAAAYSGRYARGIFLDVNDSSAVSGVDTVHEAYGVYVDLDFSGSVAVNNLWANEIAGYFDSAGNMGTTGTTGHYGVYGVSSGTATNNYGGYFSATGADTNWGIWVAAGDVALDADNQKLYFGEAQDYSIEWDGDDAVHTISAGDFVFTGGNLNLSGTAAPLLTSTSDGSRAMSFGASDSGFYTHVGTTTNHDFLFITNNTETGRIHKDGTWLIDTDVTDANASLVVRGSRSYYGLTIRATDGPRIFFDYGAEDSEVQASFFGLQSDEAFVVRQWIGSGTDNLFIVQSGGARTQAADLDALKVLHNGYILMPNDDAHLQIGATATDLELYSDGTDGAITVSGGLRLGSATTNYVDIQPDGEIQLVGTARVKKEFGVILTDFNPGASGPTKALHDIFPTYEFTINDDMHTSFELPTDWAVGTDIEVEVYWAIDEAYVTNSGEVRWSADWRAVAVGEVISGGASGTMDFGDVNIPATANTVVKTEATLSGASLAMDDLIAFNGARVALVAGSNPTAEPYIIAVRVEYLVDKLGEST